MATFKEEILEAYAQGDIAQLYVWETRARDELCVEELMGFYANILELAFERVSDALEHVEKLSMEDVHAVAALRAIYEYAIEHYSAGSVSEASALFDVLLSISSDEHFVQAMQIHHQACEAKINFDTFLEEYADLDQTQASGKFYIAYFKQQGEIK